MQSGWVHVYVVYRVDDYRIEPTKIPNWNHVIAIRTVFRTEQEAEIEVVRLTELNSSKGVLYFYQSAKIAASDLSPETT
jgi:hypothetical protein